MKGSRFWLADKTSLPRTGEERRDGHNAPKHRGPGKGGPLYHCSSKHLAEGRAAAQRGCRLRGRVRRGVWGVCKCFGWAASARAGLALQHGLVDLRLPDLPPLVHRPAPVAQ